MAIFHLKIKVFSYSGGSGAIARAAYRSGERLYDERDGMYHSSGDPERVVHSEILLPENAPEEYHDRTELWNAVEKIETGARAQYAREFEFSLPVELSREQQIELARKYIRDNFVSAGMCADWSLHDKGDGNPHVHCMCTLRRIEADGSWAAFKTKKIYANDLGADGRPAYNPALPVYDPGRKDETAKYRIPQLDEKSYGSIPKGEDPALFFRQPDSSYRKQKLRIRPGKGAEKLWHQVTVIKNPWNSKTMAETWRAAWAGYANEALKAAGISEQIDHRSFKRQGLDLIPTIHEGPDVLSIERRMEASHGPSPDGGFTEIRRKNTAIREHNQEIKILMGIEKLQEKLREILVPVQERLEAYGRTAAEKLEKLRAGIIRNRVQINRTAELRGEAESRITENEAYIREIRPVQKSKIDNLSAKIKSMQEKESSLGIFHPKEKDRISDEIKKLKSIRRLYRENQKYASRAGKKIDGLKETVKSADEQISRLKKDSSQRIASYRKLILSIPDQDRPAVAAERLKIRHSMEGEAAAGMDGFKEEAMKVDAELRCSETDLGSQTQHLPKLSGEKMKLD